MLEKMDFFMQEFRTWSRQLDKLLVTGAAAGFTRQATYEKECAELRKTHRRMKQAQEWLSTINLSY